MELHLSPENEDRLSKLALGSGRDAAALAREVIGRYLDAESRFIETVEAGEVALDRDDVLTHGEVGIQVDLLLRS